MRFRRAEDLRTVPQLELRLRVQLRLRLEGSMEVVQQIRLLLLHGHPLVHLKCCCFQMLVILLRLVRCSFALLMFRIQSLPRL